MIDLTARVAEIAARADVAEGLCSVYTPHATAAIVINENDDPNVCVDVLDALDRLVPAGVWRHDKVDGNAASHIQATILGPRSEEHTSELQSPMYLVCRLLLE